ncbi:hypothetical protein VZT92_021656 [Zoarces viviparus]|uniref:Uncharacterized protein n=1 Tax=Zoarces viviparus TaxID=48416 RepID=A0AAW1EB57_ZOAVI
MDQESGAAAAAPAGSFISLNEHEQRYYSGLHSLCQADASGTLSSGKVAELFKASQLPPKSLHKVSVSCSAGRVLSSVKELRPVVAEPRSRLEGP